ncbi:hypothetical protein B7C51_24980 (plasmid) [Paenibacillus larvae subsp. pulvifaciens]|uniref:DUF433 domain-containing protein n=1 Tax=Paenibacillus larvae subsp. pulvifaciens TaxID=1477 RepID=A0A1V0V000_9BACL|nr:DUF433 domain-containing protein [Paenibacillus larvae]ARF70729.1 hypothetical protein B7C51_24980 [Paenibacillus larvae subsp. pulvifaciens]
MVNQLIQTKIKSYFKSIADNYPDVSMNAEIISGMPVIKGSRIPISLIISCLSDGMNIDEICSEYNLKVDEVRNSLEFVIEVIDRPFFMRETKYYSEPILLQYFPQEEIMKIREEKRKINLENMKKTKK